MESGDLISGQGTKIPHSTWCSQNFLINLKKDDIFLTGDKASRKTVEKHFKIMEGKKGQPRNLYQAKKKNHYKRW